jgi:hypothetical protein
MLELAFAGSSTPKQGRREILRAGKLLLECHAPPISTS